MGKEKVRRFRNRRQNPLAEGSSQRARSRGEAFGASVTQASPVPPSGDGPTDRPPAVMSKLCSSRSAADKGDACQCVANWVFNHDYLRLLLKHGIVGKLSALLLDDSVSVREVAAGAFRNLTLAVEPSAESEVTSAEVLSSLPVLIRECHHALDTKGPAPPDGLDLWMSVAEQALHTMWNLVELSTLAVEAVQREQLVPVLVDFTQHHWTLATPSAQCLYSVLDDNPALSVMLAGSEGHWQKLMELLPQQKKNKTMKPPQGEELHTVVVQTAVCGALHCLLPYLQPSHSPELVSALCCVLESVIAIDAVSSFRLAAPADRGPDHSPHCSHSKRMDQECEYADVWQRLEAQRLALEVLTNMACSDEDDDEEWEVMEKDDMLMGEELGTSPSELMRSMVQHHLYEKVTACCRLTYHPALQGLHFKDGLHPLQQCAVDVQITALKCLQNMLPFPPAHSWSNPSLLLQMWGWVLQQAKEKECQLDSDLLEATLGLLREVLLQMDNIQHVTNPDLEFLCGLACTPSLPPPACTSAVRVLGEVARLASPGTPEDAALQAVAKAFSQVLSTSPHVGVQAEVMDCVFDAFGKSDSSAALVASSGLLATLCALQPVFTDKVTQLEEGGQDQAVVEVARTNLPLFIQYIKGVTSSGLSEGSVM